MVKKGVGYIEDDEFVLDPKYKDKIWLVQTGFGIQNPNHEKNSRCIKNRFER